MSIYFTSLACLSVLVLGCGSNNNGVDTSSSGGACNFGCGMGGTGYGGDGGSVGGNASLKGGKTVASAELLAKLNKDACSGWSSELEPPAALLEFVVDVSGSMSEVPKNSTQTKWQITQAALSNAINTGLTDRTGVGILFFPNMNTVPNHNTTPIDVTNCVNTTALIPAAPLGPQGSTQRASIAQGLANAYVAGGTPTDDAYDYAYVSGVVPALQTYGYFNPFMVLITDGQPTISLGCEGTGQTAYPVDWHPIVADIATAFSNRPLVKTFIIGSPGSEAQSSTGLDGRPWLSQAARTGGTPITQDCVDTGPNFCHFDMTQSLDFAADLAQALADIINQAVPCSFKLPAPTNGQQIDPTKLAVFYEENVVGGTATQEWLIGQTSDTTCAGGSGDGWYIDPVSGVMTLCPTTCDTVQRDKYAKLNVVGGCMPPQIIFT